MRIKEKINTYKDLIVWQKSMNLVIAIYELTELYPKSELFSLISQSRRSAISIPSNIAEGRRRGTRKDYRQFLIMAYGSGAELETQLEIAKMLSFGKNLDFTRVDGLLDEIMRMLNKIINNLKS